MLSISTINSVSYRVSKGNSEKQSSAPQLASRSSALMPSIPAAAYGLSFGNRGDVSVNLNKALKRIFGHRFQFVIIEGDVVSVTPMTQKRAEGLLRYYHKKQNADFRAIAAKADPANIEAFYVNLLGHVEKYPLEWGYIGDRGKLSYTEINISSGSLFEIEPGKAFMPSNPKLSAYFDKELPVRIKANGGKTPDDLVKVVEYKGKKYQITPELVQEGDAAGIALDSRELKAA